MLSDVSVRLRMGLLFTMLSYSQNNASTSHSLGQCIGYRSLSSTKKCVPDQKSWALQFQPSVVINTMIARGAGTSKYLWSRSIQGVTPQKAAKGVCIDGFCGGFM